MDAPRISNETLRFLTDLNTNNSREWFEAHRTEYEAARTNAVAFRDALTPGLRGHDAIDKVKLFRIYRDLRFSKDKTPYKPHFAFSFSRLGAERRGGYYLRIRPGSSFIACGFWDPNKEDLLRIRKELEQDAGAFKRAVSGQAFRSIWGDLQGESVKTAPKGFDRDHPEIELIRKKQFIFTRDFTDPQVLSPSFLGEVGKSYRLIRPFFDVMSEILTTDLNGESILDQGRA
jgi:uncharacterized protein (TIGR02453 family)